MAEPTCLMQPFPYTTTPTPPFKTHQETNSAMHGLGESISFGSYVYEDIEWEKWSSFNEHNRNRYVAEAEKYSKPGSVAQKKAYFEAHYKKKAALRAAALPEQEQNDVNDTFRDEANNVTTYDHGKDSKSSSNSPTETNGFDCVKTENSEDLVVNRTSKKVNSSLPPPPPPPPPSHRRSYQNYSDYDMKNEVNHDVHNEESSSEVTNQIEKPVLQEESIEVAVEVKKKIIPLSFYLSSPEVEVGKSDLIHPGIEIAATSSKTFTPENPAKASLHNIVSQPQLMDPDLTKNTGATTSSNSGRRKISLSIILKSCCLRNEERTLRRKQEKAESERIKFR